MSAKGSVSISPSELGDLSALPAGFYGPQGAKPWPLLVLEERCVKSPDFDVKDALQLIKLLQDKHPEYVNVTPTSLPQELSQEILEDIFQNNDFASTKAIYTFVCDLIEFKNKQYASAIPLPGQTIVMRRPAPSISPTHFVWYQSALSARQLIIELIGSFDQLSSSEQRGLIFLSAMFNGGLIDAACQMEFLKTELKSSKVSKLERESHYPSRYFFSSITKGWICDPVTQGLVNKLYEQSEETYSPFLYLCGTRSEEKAILKFLLELKWFFEALYDFNRRSCAYTARVCSSFRSIGGQLRKRGWGGKSTKRQLITRLLNILKNMAESFYAFNMSPIHLHTAAGRFNTTSLAPSLYTQSMSWAGSGSIRDSGREDGSKSIIQRNRVLASKGLLASKSLEILLGKIMSLIDSNKAHRAREQVLNVLTSKDLDGGEDVPISQPEDELFSFLVAVAKSELEVGHKSRQGIELTKFDIFEFLNFLTVGFVTFLPSLQEAESKASQLGFEVGLTELEEADWIDLIEDAHQICPKRFRATWFACLTPILEYLEAQGVYIDIEELDFTVEQHHLGYYGARAHYAMQDDVLTGLWELRASARNKQRGISESSPIGSGSTTVDTYSIAFLVGTLCLYLGLRLREATGLLLGDVQWHDEESFLGYIIIRPSLLRTLKSGQAIRQLPLGLIPFQLRKDLYHFWRESNKKDCLSDPLFKQSEQNLHKSFSQAISALIVKALRTNKALNFMTVHSLRHAAINNIWAAIGISHRWLLPEACFGTALGTSLEQIYENFNLEDGHYSVEGVGEVVEDADAEKVRYSKTEGVWYLEETGVRIERIRKAGLYLYRQMAGRDLESYEQPMDSYAYLIKFAGHLNSRTTVHTYLHFMELAVYSEVHETFPELKREQIYSLYDIKKAWVTKKLTKRPQFFNDIQWLGLQGGKL